MSEVTTDREVTLATALAVLGVFVTYVPITAVSVALSAIGRATAASTSDLQWVSDGYVIPMAAAVLSAGLFGDRYGRRRVYLVGMALTVVGAVVAGLGGTVDGRGALHLLWAGQAVSGLGAGLLLPTTLALIAHAVPDPRRRGRYVGLWATGLLLGLALGPLVSGGILETATWGWIYVPTAGLALAAGVIAHRRLPESRAAEPRPLDWPGQLTAAVAIATSIWGVIEGGAHGWTSAGCLAGLAVGAAAGVAFAAVELRSAAPLLDLRLFRSPAFTAAGFSALVALFSVVGAMFLLSLFLGYVQQLSPLQIGLRLLFVSGVAAGVNPLVAPVLHRANPLLLLGGGLALAAAGVLALTGVDAGTGFADLAWRLALFGIAVALVLVTVSVAAINAVPWQRAGMASAANTAMRQYGGALGPAVLGAVYASRVGAGATPVGALHTGLVVTAVVLGVASVGCLAAVRR